MAIDISSTTRRIVYTGSAGVGPYAFNFEILAQTDIAVYKNDTELTLTTDYTVSISGDGTGSVTLVVAATGSDRITIVGDRTIERSTDFTTGGPLFATSLNDEFDSLTIFAQQNLEANNRAIKAPVTDPSSINMTLPKDTDRKGKYLSFNATTGNPEVVNTVTDVTTIAGIASDVTTVSGIAADVTTVADNDANVTIVANNISSVNTVATNISSVIAVANDLAEAVSEVETVANDLNEAVSEIDTVATSITNVDAVGTNITNVNTVAGISADVTTVAGIDTEVQVCAGISSNITILATQPLTADISFVASIDEDVSTVAGIASDVTAVAAVASDVSAIAAIDSNVTSVANISSDVTTVATNVADITNFADVYIGPSATDPATRADSSALQAGDMYFNTTGNSIKVYTGSGWDVAFVGGAGYLQSSNNLSDLTNAATALINLGVTATAAELNVLDGITATLAELNYTDGVTSNIQTQLDAKVAKTASTGSAVMPVGTDGERDGSPSAGYLRFNTTSTSFEGYDGSAWGAIGGGGGASASGAIYENTTTISENYTLTTGSNGFSVGPMTIAAGYAVTVPSGQRWVIL